MSVPIFRPHQPDDRYYGTLRPPKSHNRTFTGWVRRRIAALLATRYRKYQRPGARPSSAASIRRPDLTPVSIIPIRRPDLERVGIHKQRVCPHIGTERFLHRLRQPPIGTPDSLCALPQFRGKTQTTSLSPYWGPPPDNEPGTRYATPWQSTDWKRSTHKRATWEVQREGMKERMVDKTNSVPGSMSKVSSQIPVHLWRLSVWR